MSRRPRRVAHVMQAVEEGYEIEILPRIALGCRDLVPSGVWLELKVA